MRPSFPILSLLLVLLGGGGAAQSRADLADLASRVDYGFYVAEPGVVEAARRELERTGDKDPWSLYYRAFASLRLAQLGAGGPDARGRHLAACVENADAAAENAAKAARAESLALLAVCATLAARAEPMKAMLHGRRAGQALESARAIEPDNPRLALAEIWAISEDPVHAEPGVQDEALAAMQTAVDAFEAWSGGLDAPDWGHAELLASMGAIKRSRGDTLGARDLLERALLIAPGYDYALKNLRSL